MSESTTSVGGFFGALPRDFKTAQPKKSMSQEVKVRILAGLTLTRLFRDGGVTVEQLEQDAAGRVTGRLSLTLGAGVGGKGGMRVLRGPGGAVLCCRDNALNLLERLGRDGFEQWLVQEKVTLAEFESWLQTLPSV
jgi:hypothetical protein